MDKIKEIIDTFEPISLKEMDSVELFNRVDTKFIFTKDKLPQILKDVKESYRVLDIGNVRLNLYETLYFDTDKYELFSDHHNGVLSRFKVRYRRYTDTDKTFFEVKYKTNKEKTIKERISQKSIQDNIKDDAEEFLSDRIKIKSEDLEPKLWVYYTRIMLVNKIINERVTIDLSLNFSNNISSKKFPNLVIAEIKQEKEIKSPFQKHMKTLHIRSNSISKYCMGIALLNDNVKKNNFKQKIKSINKLCYE